MKFKMNDDIEQRLSKIVLESTMEASREEWKSVITKNELPLYNYRYDHVLNVVKLVKIIGSQTNANMDILLLAAWLHDIAKPGIGGVSEHGIKSAQATKKILSEFDIDQSVLEKVVEIIEKHVGLTLEKPLEPIEAQLLWEADKLDKIGLTGIIHFIINGIRIKPNQRIFQMVTNIVDFIPLAERIGASMFTEKSKEIAKIRLKNLKEFARSLQNEILV